MLNTSQTFINQETLPVAVRALRSITQDQVRTAVQALSAHDDLWIVDQHVDYDGYLSLVITHHVHIATFVISGTVDRIEIAVLREEELQPLGVYQTFDEALLQIRK